MDANLELLEYYVERYNAGDLDSCMSLYTVDASQRMHDGIFEGIDQIRARLARDLEAFEDAKYVVDSFFAAGDEFADEWTFTGTNTWTLRLPARSSWTVMRSRGFRRTNSRSCGGVKSASSSSLIS